MWELRVSLIVGYLSCSGAMLISMIALDDPELFVKIFGFLATACWYGFLGTFLWNLMPHRLWRYYTGPTPFLSKIVSTVFWVNLPLLFLAYMGRFAAKKPTIDPSWFEQLTIKLAEYFQYFIMIFASSVFAMFISGVASGAIVLFAKRVFVVNGNRGRDD